jgi:hypothetical protein
MELGLVNAYDELLAELQDGETVEDVVFGGWGAFPAWWIACHAERVIMARKEGVFDEQEI